MSDNPDEDFSDPFEHFTSEDDEAEASFGHVPELPLRPLNQRGSLIHLSFSQFSEDPEDEWDDDSDDDEDNEDVEPTEESSRLLSMASSGRFSYLSSKLSELEQVKQQAMGSSSETLNLLLNPSMVRAVLEILKAKEIQIVRAREAGHIDPQEYSVLLHNLDSIRKLIANQTETNTKITTHRSLRRPSFTGFLLDSSLTNRRSMIRAQMKKHRTVHSTLPHTTAATHSDLEAKWARVLAKQEQAEQQLRQNQANRFFTPQKHTQHTRRSSLFLKSELEHSPMFTHPDRGKTPFNFQSPLRSPRPSLPSLEEKRRKLTSSSEDCLSANRRALAVHPIKSLQLSKEEKEKAVGEETLLSDAAFDIDLLLFASVQEACITVLEEIKYDFISTCESNNRKQLLNLFTFQWRAIERQKSTILKQIILKMTLLDAFTASIERFDDVFEMFADVRVLIKSVIATFQLISMQHNRHQVKPIVTHF